LAPGMGQNFFFVFSALPVAVAAGGQDPWRTTLGAVFIAALFFLAISMTRLREKIIDAVSPSMKRGIAVGIGLFIAFIGLRNGGVVVTDPGTAVKLNSDIVSPDIAVFFVGFIVAATLHARRTPASILWGILAALGVTFILYFGLPELPASVAQSPVVAGSMLVTRFAPADGLLAVPPSLAPTFLKMDVMAALTASMIPIIVIFLFTDVFDTAGTLIGVAEQADLLENGKLPRANRAMFSDALGTAVGACLGTSTVTSYIESAAGVEAGGRTGLTAVVVAVLFLVALFLYPVVAMIGSYPPITAPALVLVGIMMMRNVTHIEWSDYSEAIPTALIVLGIPFFFSIADGIALGLVAYPVIRSLSGRRRDVTPAMWLLGGVLLAYFLFVRTQI
ncbi:MAG: NCS2 family permease, partial [Gemmatimonadales bacterium]